MSWLEWSDWQVGSANEPCRLLPRHVIYRQTNNINLSTHLASEWAGVLESLFSAATSVYFPSLGLCGIEAACDLGLGRGMSAKCNLENHRMLPKPRIDEAS